jgi:gliding motility-associated lipoprotein GldH
MSLRNSMLFFRKGILLGCIAASFWLISCDKKRVFDEYKTVGSAWNKDSIVSWTLPQVDTTKAYNLYVNLRSNDDYPFNNLFLIVALDQPGGITKVDTLEYEMADEDGNLLGDGFTDIKESRLVYKEHAKFKKGQYKIHIRHAVRETGKVSGVKTLKGISDVGFRIESID